MNRVALVMMFLGSMALPSASANAAEYIYAAGLSGGNEVPAVVTTGSGHTRVTYNDAAHSLRVEITFADLIGTTTASHIHVRPPGMDNGGVATQVPSFAGFPLGVQAGSYDNIFDLTLASSWNPAFITANGGTVGGAEAALFTGLQDGRSYVNVHSSFRPGGEIRGNLAAIPEPAAWALMLLGFGLVGATMRRRPALATATA